MNEFNEEKKGLSEGILEEVTGGRKHPFDPGMGIQWDDPRCDHAARWAGSFGDRMQDCPLYSQKEKELVKKLCADFRVYINTEQYFDLNAAKDVYLHIASVLTAYSLTPEARGAWQAFTNVFYSIFS